MPGRLGELLVDEVPPPSEPDVIRLAGLVRSLVGVVLEGVVSEAALQAGRKGDAESGDESGRGGGNIRVSKHGEVEVEAERSRRWF